MDTRTVTRRTLLIGAAAAALTACDPTIGTNVEGDRYPPKITKMEHQPEVKGHWGKIEYVKSRECWAIWYHSPFTNKVVKTCAEHKTYRKYKVGMEYDG